MIASFCLGVAAGMLIIAIRRDMPMWFPMLFGTLVGLGVLALTF